jgi:hypothetical protein
VAGVERRAQDVTQPTNVRAERGKPVPTFPRDALIVLHGHRITGTAKPPSMTGR